MITPILRQESEDEWEVTLIEGNAVFVTTFSKMRAKERALQFIAWQRSLLGDELKDLIEVETE